MRRRHGLPVTQGQDSSDGTPAHGFGQLLRRSLGLLEMQGHGAVRPGIVKLVAAVAADDNFQSQEPGRLNEAAGLVAQLAGQQQ